MRARKEDTNLIHEKASQNWQLCVFAKLWLQIALCIVILLGILEMASSTISVTFEHKVLNCKVSETCLSVFSKLLKQTCLNFSDFSFSETF